MKQKSTKQTLLVNFRAGLGDFLLMTPMLRGLCESKMYNIFFIGNTEISDIVKDSGYFTKYFFINYKKHALNKLTFLVKMFYIFFVNVKVDICITPVSTLGRFNDFIAFASRAKRRIGFSNYDHLQGSCTDLIRIDTDALDIESNLKVLDMLGVKHITNHTEIPINSKSIARINTYLAETQLCFPNGFAAIAAFVKGAKGCPSREWPIERFIDLSKLILKKIHCNIVFVGTKAELNRLGCIKNSLPINKVFFQDSAFSISDTAALIKKARFLVCNDGGMMHIGAAVNVPVVSIWGPTDPAWRGYWDRENFINIYKKVCVPCQGRLKIIKCDDRKCITAISTEEVYNACETMFNRY